ncbi:MAG TPA: cyclodeaminase/cyclohydrolase family protein [Mobilitalea sp.]|nr:cyclodeaminase/cyclohydrolase family protein [Mobilitalea sp.]
MNMAIQNFMMELSSGSPVPGGGGVSALIGAVGVSLCSMVANLTSGKKKYAQFQEDIDAILPRTQDSISRLLELIRKDAEVFEPLSAAYGIPKDVPERDEILEEVLVTACSVPMEILQEVYCVIDIIEQLSHKGSKLAVSDVGVAASACRSAMEGASMNVYINTKLMKNREYALEMNERAMSMLKDGVERCDKVYQRISEELRCR